MPALPGFMERHPQVQIEMINTGSVADMHVTGADLNFRLGPLDDSDLVARRLAAFQVRRLRRAPSYVSVHGKPHHPQELAMHRTLVHKSPRSATIHPLGPVDVRRSGGRGIRRRPAPLGRLMTAKRSWRRRSRAPACFASACSPLIC